jgi:LEA14-like dessication related protein
MIKIIVVAAIASLLFSCRSLKPPVFNGIGNLRINKLSMGQSIMTLDLNFFNPNHSKARLKNAEGDAWMDSVFLGHFVVDSSIRIPSNGDFFIPVKLNVDMKFILQHTLSAFLNEEVLIRITGNARVGKGGIYGRYPLNYSGKQNLSKLFQ